MTHARAGKLICWMALLTSGLLWLEWGGGNEAFLFGVEAEMFRKGLLEPASLIHPLIFLGLGGQAAALFLGMQKSPWPPGVMALVAALGQFALLVLAAGLAAGRYRMVLSAIPFVLVFLFALRWYRSRPGSGIRPRA